MQETLQTPAKGERKTTSSPKDTVNILLVDDQPGKLMANEAILSELGQRIIKARTGVDALAHLLRYDFAVILLDVNMPDMDGFETAALIRQRPRFEKTPIIFITGYNTTDVDRLKGYELGAVDYLFLPVVPQVLKAKVSVFVELARQTQIIKSQAADLSAHNSRQAEQLEVIQKLNYELKNANSELEAFSYTVSHDLRAPLRSISGFVNVLMEDYGARLDETGRSHLAALDRAAKRMDSLTRDLLAYGRVARESVTLEPVALEPLLEAVVSLNGAGKAYPANILIEPGLGHVMGHRFLLEQCLSNLISNATKFVAPGVTPQVRIRTESRGPQVRLWIEDNGIGIDPTYHRKIFNMFERVGDLHRYEGTGIGLAIVHRAVQRMGGACGVESSRGEGSRFWLDLLPVTPPGETPNNHSP
ncbi:MAG: sensor histidine kinase [Limisphaerales bacterium]